MGLSQSIRDDDVTAPLPEFEGDSFRTAAFAKRTKLSHFIATIDSGELKPFRLLPSLFVLTHFLMLFHNAAIYGPDGRLSSNFLLRTKDTLASMADLPDELHEQFPIDLNNKKVGISRLSAHIHLLFHQVSSTSG